MEPSTLKSIADNPILFEAVRAEILKQFTFDAITTDMDNENMGAVCRGVLDGKKRVEQGFIEILNHKTPVEETPEPMRAR